MKPWMKISAGLTLALSVIGFIVIWDVKIKDEIDSVEVVVVRPGVEILPNEPLSRDKLLVEKRRRTSIVEGTVLPNELENVLGTFAKHHLVGNSLLSKRSLDFEGLQPNPYLGEAIRPIPNDWIYAKPSTLRRNDKISLYLFAPPEKISGQSSDMTGLSPQQIEKLKELEEKQKEESAEFQEERENIAAENKVELPESEDAEQRKRNALLTEQEKDDLSDEQVFSYIEAGEIPILVDIPIIYAKDGSGNEVLNGENSSQEQRLTSTGTISDLELILTEDEYRFLKEYIDQGYKLYITYV
ncbi:hypothetical protein K7887_22520 (plasmid) [Sutcliffiella horikoshii]|uniref:hypothetical protein n=1 Tax=Sutcliffiella horikoshii TaxID=79883 RepID=UPI001CC087EC|nr:hypothetical protein [Sutcliffiella horikoshii]UAL49744.1 hypothetical protein K7887_22520 [Sutcliffiella horikoshii]